MQESTIEKYLVRRVNHSGGRALKFTTASMAGMPDRLVLLPGGVVFFAEMKRPGAKPRPLQLAAHRILEGLGLKVYIIDTKEKAAGVLNDYGI